MIERGASAAAQDTQKRFRFFVIVFRMSGVPLLFNKVPRLYKLYAASVIFCCYVTLLTMVADVFINTEDLEHTMETVRAAFPAAMLVWIQAFLR
jgi:hypothetical protein